MTKAGLAKLFLGMIAASCAVAVVHAQDAGVAAPGAAARAAWGFDRSDLTPHPQVRFGVLANGMRYALTRHGAQPGRLSVRLRIDAGSRDEGEREGGYMHLIEHLIFHGSANLPRGALPLMLHHQGLARWSDFDAFTSFDETVFRLELSRSDSRARETALTVMREIASHLVFTGASVRGARDMVAQEIGARDALQDRIATAQNAFFVPGSSIARGPVAGTRASIGRARGRALRRLYERTYVPRAATLVLAGDFDPAAVEAEIARHFADWQPRSQPAAGRPQTRVASARGVEARLFVDPAAPTRVTIANVAPLGGPDAGPRRDTLFLEHLASQMLAARLEVAATGRDSPFDDASSAAYDHFSSARIVQIEVGARDGDWRKAVRAAAREFGRALREGFSQAELDRQLAASGRALAADAAPRTSRALADGIVDATGRGIVFTAPADRGGNEAYLARVRPEHVDAALRAAWASPTRLIFVTHKRPISNAAESITAAWTEAVREAR